MKKIISLILPICIAAMIIGCKDKNEKEVYEITGTATNQNTSKDVLLLSYSGDTLQHSKIVDGKFHLKGHVEKPRKAVILLGQNNAINFILENDTYSLKTAPSKPAKIVGGKLNTLVYGFKQQEDYKKALLDFQKTSDSVFSGIDMMDEEALKYARAASWEKREVLLKIKNTYQRNILEGDYSVYAKLFTLSENYDWKHYDMEKRLALYNAYEKEIGEHPLSKLMKNFIQTENKRVEMAKTVDAGSPFKEVVAVDVDGNQIELSEVIANNKYTLLEMWASWCGPCRGEFPHLKEAYKKYHDEGFEIYALSLDKKEKNWIKALKEEDVPWINVVDHKAFDSEAAKKYAVMGIPASFLISSDGTIIASHGEVRGFALDKKLEELFGKDL